MQGAAHLTIQELERAFQEALELDGAAREHYLDKVCAGRPALRQRLEAMLAADEEAPAGFIETPLLETLPAAVPGERFGRWRLEEQIGEGGLGVVYRGVAVEDGVTVEAAIKVLRPGFDAGLFRDRFQQERQILAGLEHPGIARLIDCGADASGRSFLAMEYVRGDTLSGYLSRPHALKERLAIFDAICETVQYLHARLVVHGDIKPGNVILTAAGHAKLLDFGTARLVQGERPGEGGMTRLLLTPQYASPEQRRGEGPSISSDIYSLGRLLDDVVPKAEADRDLRAISQRCQAEAPADRYQSVGALLEDLRRYREGFPVRAREATAFYALSRFARRQWAVVTLSALLTTALVSGWWMASRSAERANRLARELERSLAASRASQQLAEERFEEAERNRLLAAESRRRAEQAAAAAQRSAAQFRSLATQLLDNGEGNVVIVREQVDANERSLRRLLAELERDPGATGYKDLVAAWTRLGALLCLKGDFPEGLAALDKALQLAGEWRARQPSDESRSAYVLNLAYRVRYLQLRGNRPLARREAARAIAEFEKLPAALRADVGRSPALQLARLLDAFEGDGRVRSEKGLATLEDVVGVQGQSDSQLAETALSQLIAIHQGAGRSEEVARWCRVAEEWVVPPYRAGSECPALAGLEAEDRQDPTAAGALEQIEALRGALRENPQHFRSRVEMARAHATLAEQYASRGRLGPARSALRYAESVIKQLAASDPGGPLVQRLAARVTGIKRTLDSRR